MTKKKRSIEWGKIAEFILVFLVLPTVLFTWIAPYSPRFLSVTYYALVTMFILQSTMLYASNVAVLPRRRFRVPEGFAGERPPVPRTTFIVSAYLPNEVNVIEETLVNLLRNIERPADDIEVILAYNSGELVGIEERLQELAKQWPELILANAYKSRSKSENINYALDIASGEMVCLLDADHHPVPDCLKRAWRWLATGYDCVQGRCKIRNGDTSVLAALVEVEFEGIYGVAHQARPFLFHTGLFGGSNGYWKKSALKELRFRTDMLTEDIDLTLRGTLAGYKVTHDRSIISTELAPETPTAWWYQRKRWAQGWFQCSVRHTAPLLRDRTLGFGPRFSWLWLLVWRLIYDSLSHLLLPVLFAFWYWRSEVVLPLNPYIVFAVLYTFLSGPFEALVSYKNAVLPRFPVRRLLLYSLVVFFYTMVKNMIQMIAIRDEWTGKREWISTPH